MEANCHGKYGAKRSRAKKEKGRVSNTSAGQKTVTGKKLRGRGREDSSPGGEEIGNELWRENGLGKKQKTSEYQPQKRMKRKREAARWEMEG